MDLGKVNYYRLSSTALRRRDHPLALDPETHCYLNSKGVLGLSGISPPPTEIFEVFGYPIRAGDRGDECKSPSGAGRAGDQGCFMMETISLRTREAFGSRHTKRERLRKSRGRL